MALQKQKIPLNLNTGIDTKTDDFTAIGFKTVENLRYTKTNALTKRSGSDELSKSVIGIGSAQPDISSGKYLITSDKEILLANNNHTYNYSNQSQKWFSNSNENSTTTANSFIAVSDYDKQLLLSNKGTMIGYHYDQNNLFGVAASYYVVEPNPGNYSAGINIKIINLEEDSTVLNEDISLVSTYAFANVRVQVFSNYAQLFYWDNAAGVIKVVKYTFGTSTITSATTSLGSLPTFGAEFFDVCNDGTDSYLALISPANSNIVVAKINSSGAVSSSTTVADATLSGYLSVCINTINSGIRVAYWTGAAAEPLRTLALNSNLTSKFAPETVKTAAAGEFIRNCAFSSDGTSTHFYYTLCRESTSFSGSFSPTPGGPGSSFYGKIYNDTTGAITTSETEVLKNVLIQDKPVFLNGQTFFGVTRMYADFYVKTYQSYYLIAVNSDMKSTAAGKSSYLQYYPQIHHNGLSARKLVIEDEKVIGVVSEITGVYPTDSWTSSTTPTTIAVNSVVKTTFDFDYNNISYTSINNGLYISGSILKYYDGQSLVEDGFLDEPVIFGYRTLAGTVTSGSYGVAILAKWVDNLGNIHRGVPNFYSYSLSAGFQFFISGGFLSQKTNAELEIYMTELNSGTYYLQYSSPLAIQGSSLFITADNQIKNNTEIIYTQANVLENDTSTISGFITSHKNRLWAADKTGIQYSKLIEENQPVSFNENLKIPVNSVGGELTAVFGMDNVLAIFKTNSISIITGEGPNNLGEQNDYGSPQPISSDVGCTEVNSIIGTPEGIMFKSEKGIYLLNRGLYTSYIGDKVEQYNSETIISSVLDNNTNEVKFLTDAGNILIYDYYHKTWLVDTATDIIDMAILNDNVYTLKADGTVFKSNQSIFTEGLNFYNGRFETNWFSVSGMLQTGDIARSQQGFQRLYTINLLAKYKSPHTLEIKVAYDYDETIVDTANITANASGTYQWEIKPSRQKCESFKLYIEDKNQSGSGESLIISGLLLEVGIKGTAQKTIPDSKRTTTS